VTCIRVDSTVAAYSVDKSIRIHHLQSGNNLGELKSPAMVTTFDMEQHM
jgi:hypothetical protein